jgi:hypothetical protein
MGKFDDDRIAFMPVFWASLTNRQRRDYELAKKYFGPMYRIEDSNYFLKKFEAMRKSSAQAEKPVTTNVKLDNLEIKGVHGPAIQQ